MEKMYILPHEFLYIIKNSQDRIQIIEENFSVDFHNEHYKICHWEIKDLISEKELISHIHLLSENAFKNRSPHLILIEKLSLLTNELELNTAQKEDFTVTKFIDKLLLKFINTKKGITSSDPYFDTELVGKAIADIQNFISTSYNREQFDNKALKAFNQELQYETGKLKTNKMSKDALNEYNPAKFRNEKGEYDFSKAPGYNEDVVRFNINKV